MVYQQLLSAFRLENKLCELTTWRQNDFFLSVKPVLNVYINTKKSIKSISIYLFRLQEKWNEIQSFAPLHMMKVEFRLDEETFVKYVKDVEKGKI